MTHRKAGATVLRMPTTLAAFLLFFGPLVGAVVLVALTAFLLEVFRSRAVVLRDLARRPGLSDADLRNASDFHARRRRFHLWAWGGLLGAAGALAADWVLTAAALGLLLPPAGGFVHLRCPACEGAPGLRGLVARRRCRRCAAYLGV